jgi:NADPH-dependent curcumin reductase CurA
MNQDRNPRVVLTRTIDGMPTADDFRITDTPMLQPGRGEVLIRHIYLSLDPYQRGAIAGRHGPGAPLGEGDMPPGETVGQIVASRHPDFAPGDYVRSFGGWQQYSVASGTDAFAVDPSRAPLSTYLGVLGMPGLTAYASIIELASVQAGQTVLVSAASGPVGTTLGQIAINKGASVTGIAGSAEKCRYVIDELGFSDCIDYKRDDYHERLQAAAGEGFDIYHDNVGGQMLADAIMAMRPYGTVVLCGLMSQYNDPALAKDLYIGLPIMKRLTMKGLVVYDFEDKRDALVDLVAPWIAAGTFKVNEDRAAGIENAGAHFARLMAGKNFGKALVVVDAE